MFSRINKKMESFGVNDSITKLKMFVIARVLIDQNRDGSSDREYRDYYLNYNSEYPSELLDWLAKIIIKNGTSDFKTISQRSKL